MASTLMTVDAELNAMLRRMGAVSLRKVLRQIARYLRQSNAKRIRAQVNADGSAYAPRKPRPNRKGKRRGKRMLLRYAQRIRDRVDSNEAVVGIFGRMDRFGAVHDQGRSERGIRYPARNLISLPDADKQVVLQMLREGLAA